jgi:cytoskeletal protein CcmA (bactofilin family)
VVREDLFIAGDTIIIEGSIEGDLYAAARTVIIRGSVRDSATIFAGTVSVDGSVGQGIHAAVGELIINGMIRGNVVAAARSASLGSEAGIEGDVIITGQKIIVSSPVKGYILGAGNTISINSSISDDASFAVRTLTLQENARISGNLMYISEKQAVIFPGATVSGKVIHRIPEFQEKMRGIFPFVLIAGVLGKIFSFVMMVVVGLAFVLIAPKWFFRLSEAIKRYPGPCAGWGALVFFAAPLGIGLAFLTFVGMALAVMASMVYSVALYLSQIITALLLGRLLLGIKEETIKPGHLFGSFVLGLFLIRLVRFIPVVGFIVWAVTVLFGIGAFVVTQMKMRASSVA